ncbi:MAG: SAM-dependent methyltransferase [Patescibacteria group bacterium]|nr:SAM-dependent methyltransferase [Patescibacteria group bacterium]
MLDDKALWRAYSKVYDELLKVIPYRNLLLEVVDRAKITHNSTVLDVCSGTGNLLWALDQRGIKCRVTGLDYSKPMLAIAAGKIQTFGATADFRQVDVNEPLSSRKIPEKFDRIILNNCLFIVDKPAGLLANLANVGQPGAVLVATLPRPNPSVHEILEEHLWLAEAGGQKREAALQYLMPLLQPLFKINKTLLERYGANGHFPSETGLREWFSQSGWEIKELRTTYANQNWLIIAEKPTTS